MMDRNVRYFVAFFAMTLCSLSVSGGLGQAFQRHSDEGSFSSSLSAPITVADSHDRSQAYFCKCSVENISCYSGGFQAPISDEMEAQLKADCHAYFEGQTENQGKLRYFWIYR